MGTLTVREEKKPLSYCFRLKSFKIVTLWLALARPQSVSFLSFELTDLRLFARIWVVTIVQVGLKVKVRGEGQWSVQKCGQCTNIYYSIQWALTGGRSSRFPLRGHQLRTSTARHAAWRGRGQQQQRSPAHVGVVTRFIRLRSLIECSYDWIFYSLLF